MTSPSFRSLLRQFRVLALAVLLPWLPLAVQAAGQDMAFSCFMYPYSSKVTWIAIANESREAINAISITCGNPAVKFATVESYGGNRVFMGADPMDSRDYNVIAPTANRQGPQTDTLRINAINGFSLGKYVWFIVHMTSGSDTCTTMFNNGTHPNAVVSVEGSNGGKGSLTLSDTVENRVDHYYSFFSDKRPRRLVVNSVADGAGAGLNYASNYVVRVTHKYNGQVETFANRLDNLELNYLSDGDQVEITSVAEVYRDAQSRFLYDSNSIPANTPPNPPRERFVADGISVNNSSLTGDPTQYRFDLNGDTVVDLRWRHEYALNIEHDFLATSSLELDSSGKPWAGPLDSNAAGNPEPETTKVHWIPHGQQVVAKIDGQVLDFTRAGLDIRYVPKAYEAEGSARGVFVNAPTYINHFTVGQAPPQRQQVNAFPMNSWGVIRYKWQIQYGVRVNMDSPLRSNLATVFDVQPAGLNVVGSGEGVFWFDPGTPLVVTSRANDGTGLSLSGWNNGDSYYFSASGLVESSVGTLMNGGPSQGASGPVAQWQPSLSSGGQTHRGLYIPGLRRPARVVWTYGGPVVTTLTSIGKYVMEDEDKNGSLDPALRSIIYGAAPVALEKISVSGNNQQVAAADMAIWDPSAKRLFPLVPGLFRATWNAPGGHTLQLLVHAVMPAQPHYPHIANTPPVQLDADPDDDFIFKGLRYSESAAAISAGSLFTAAGVGRSVLLFGNIKREGRGEPKEFMEVRVVGTRNWNDNPLPPLEKVIGQRIEDPSLDRAGLGTGYVLFGNARYNANVYDASKLDGLAAKDVYDMSQLRSTAKAKVVVSRDALPGPVIPVNLHPGASPTERIVVVWYYDPALTDLILWPHAARSYLPRWPVNESEGLGRIVIASRHGSESLSATGSDQLVAPAISRVLPNGSGGFVTNLFPAATTYDPSRIQNVSVYVQNDITQPGYNPNEEHALTAPSLRFAQVSPRPPAAYALRDNDLNRYNAALPGEAGQNAGYTSHPYVLVQFFDTADEETKMRVYRVVKQDPAIPNHSFVNQQLVTIPAGAKQVSAAPLTLNGQPKVVMEAGEPVIPFYPLGVVIGASPMPETFGTNIKEQSTYWEDHKGTSWAVSGGTDAWFTHSVYYPLAPDFWWSEIEPGTIQYNPRTGVRSAQIPFTGDSISFLPSGLNLLRTTPAGTSVTATIEAGSKPILILYKSDWPKVAPTLKAGETLTYSGGEYRADHPTQLVADDNGNLRTVETPGLPAVLGFAVAEIAFDSLNPKGQEALLTQSWTARAAQVLDVRSVPLSIEFFPSSLEPANGRTRVDGGKYIFNDLPASLQRRLRYDPLAQSVDPVSGLTINGRLELTGLINDKDIGEPTLTAAPPAVYVLEPNIMTSAEMGALLLLAPDGSSQWVQALVDLAARSRNPDGIQKVGGVSVPGQYLVGLQKKVERDPITQEPLLVPIEPDSTVMIPKTNANQGEPARQFGPGLAVIPNGGFLDPLGLIPNPGGTPTPYPDISWITLVENNDPSMGGSPVTLHVIKVDRNERYRGAIKTVLSDNVFDENTVLRHTGDFGGNAEDLVFEWWYRADDGSLNVMPPFVVNPSSAGPWLFFPDLTGNKGVARNQVLLKGNPNAPESLIADSWWFVRYRHKNDVANGTDWRKPQPNLDPEVNFTWAGAGNNDPFHDFDLDGYPDYRAQLAMGWIKRVLDAVNPYEARIRDFTGDSPSTVSSMLQQLGARFEGPVALNPAKNVIENVGLIELYETVLKRARDLSIDLSTPVSTPAIANALQLASTRLSDFYTLLGNEAYGDAVDPTIGFGSTSVEYGTLAPVVHAFQNQVSSLIEEELGLLRGMDEFYARPVYNRLFWNFTKGEGEAAYAMNYNVSDITADGFIDEDDAMVLYPQGHGDAWGHYLSATRRQYSLLRHPYFNWVSRSEFYNLQDIVIKVDFLDERKFAQVAAAKAKAGADLVNLTYREKYVQDPSAQWQGYTDVNEDRAWGVQEWARRAGQGAYFDWITANALLPSVHPNETLEGIQKVDRKSNGDLRVVSASLNAIQRTLDESNQGLNPLGLAKDTVLFDLDPSELDSELHDKTFYEQIYDRAVGALNNAVSAWDHANANINRVRAIANTEAEFRNQVYQEDLAYRNQLIQIFGRPYDGTVGPGKLYPAGYDGPDLSLYMYVNVREINDQTVPGPSKAFASFNSAGQLTGGDISTAFPDLFNPYVQFPAELAGLLTPAIAEDMKSTFAGTFALDSQGVRPVAARDGWYAVDYTDVADPKVALEGLSTLMPVKAAGYTFQAPVAWGGRPAVGELQSIIGQMVQQEAAIAEAIGAWDALTGEIIRTMRLASSAFAVSDTIEHRRAAFVRARYIIQVSLAALQAAFDAAESAEEVAEEAIDGAVEMLPENLPTGGLAVSPGDALAPARGGVMIGAAVGEAILEATKLAVSAAAAVEDIAMDIAEQELDLADDADERKQAKREMLKSIEDLMGDEPIRRIAIFKEIEALRALSEQYRTLVSTGARLIDEREAYNKRVAAMTQVNRYQDMTFRVARNHALQVYQSTLDLAAKYTYLAAKAYDYETNFDVDDPGSPFALYEEIIRARTLGRFVDGTPEFGEGGLSHVLAWLRTNYTVLKSQLGMTNPQAETGKMSLRSELFRILPPGSSQPQGNSQFPGGGQDSDALWVQTLKQHREPNLWDVPEFRIYARPFAASEAGGVPVKEPGLVIRFSTTIIAGKNCVRKAAERGRPCLRPVGVRDPRSAWGGHLVFQLPLGQHVPTTCPRRRACT
jgi:hypothetical protein